MTAPRQTTSTAKDEATAVAGTAKDEAGQVASTARGAAGDVAGTARQEAGHVVDEAVTQVKDLTGQVREQATQQLDTQSERLTEGLRGISRQIAEGDTSGVVGQVMSEVGQRLQAAADHLEQVGPQGLLAEARDRARRSPGTFLLTMAVAGFATGRLVKGMSGGGSEDAPTGYAAMPYPDPTYADAAYASSAYDSPAYDSPDYVSGTGPYETPAYAVGDATPAYGVQEATDPTAAYEPGATGWAEPAPVPPAPTREQR